MVGPVLGRPMRYRNDNIERIYRGHHPPAGQQDRLVFVYFNMD